MAGHEISGIIFRAAIFNRKFKGFERKMPEGFVESIKSGYYFLEDKYYALLDKINEKIPVYSVVDPIDSVFPSFILVIIILLLLAALILFHFFPFLFAGGSTVTFSVVDESGKALS